MPGFAEGDTEEDEATSDAHHSPEKARSLRSWAMREKTKNRVSGSNISDLEMEPGLVPEICYCTTHIGFIVLSKTSKNNGISCYGFRLPFPAWPSHRDRRTAIFCPPERSSTPTMGQNTSSNMSDQGRIILHGRRPTLPT